MPSRSAEKTDAQNAADYGFARVRDIAFDAVHSLWRKRHEEGMKQTDIAKAINRNPTWVNRSLRGPGNWTLRTLGELVQGLNGEIEITVHGIEEGTEIRSNYQAYADYEPAPVMLRVPRSSPVPGALTATTSMTSGDQTDLLRRFGINPVSTAVPHE